MHGRVIWTIASHKSRESGAHISNKAIMLVWSDFYNVKLKYKLHHEVQVSSRFTYRGPQAQGCVNHEETEPSDVTDLYQAGATWL